MCPGLSPRGASPRPGFNYSGYSGYADEIYEPDPWSNLNTAPPMPLYSVAPQPVMYGASGQWSAAPVMQRYPGVPYGASRPNVSWFY